MSDELEITADAGAKTEILAPIGLSEPLPSVPSGDGPVEGRDPHNGRFLAGNHLGRGSPLAGQAAKLRAALFRAVKAGDVQDIVRAMIERAKAGDVPSARIILGYTLGEPASLDLVEKIEKLEAIYIRSRG
jgi:hypothetical protein